MNPPTGGPDRASPAASGPVAVSVVGSTGSIGTQTLDVVREDPDHYRVVALGAQRSVDQLVAQALEFRPRVVAVGDASLAAGLAARLPSGTEVVAGVDGLAAIATEADVVVNGVVGFAGLTVTLAALESGSRLALANKESIIAGAPVVSRVRRTPGAEIIPVDSEHCAVHQCLRTGRAEDVSRLLLTASGGPFRGRKADELAEVGVEEALAHPTWSMGPKITVDSSTLMNKGLEVIEAHELFGVPYDAIDVVVHPQSVVHSMVEFVDGAVVAQLSHARHAPAHRICPGLPRSAAHARSAPSTGPRSRYSSSSPRTGSPSLAWTWPIEAGRAGDLAPAWLNAANEVAVAAFLDGSDPVVIDRPGRGGHPRPVRRTHRTRRGRHARSPHGRRRPRRRRDGPPGGRDRGGRAGGGHMSSADLLPADLLPPEPPAPPPSPERVKSPRRSALELAVALAAIVAVAVLTGYVDLLIVVASIIVIVMLHELGHFVTAKHAGMKVTEYFVGFGPRLWSFRRGETEYGVKALPFGGYVKIPGMTNLEEVDPADEARTLPATSPSTPGWPWPWPARPCTSCWPSCC